MTVGVVSRIQLYWLNTIRPKAAIAKRSWGNWQKPQKVRILTMSVSILDRCLQILLERRVIRLFFPFAKIRSAGKHNCGVSSSLSNSGKFNIVFHGFIDHFLPEMVTIFLISAVFFVWLYILRAWFHDQWEYSFWSLPGSGRYMYRCAFGGQWNRLGSEQL